MFKRITIITLCMAVIAGLSTFAQTKGYIDVESVKNKIAALEAENTKLDSEKNSLTSENDSLAAKLKSQADELNNLNTILEKLIIQGVYLSEQSSNTIDKAAKKKASDAYNEYKDILAKMTAKKNQLENTVNANQNKTNQINDRLATISYITRMNNAKIETLKDAITNTQNKLQDIDNQLAQFQSVKQEAQKFIQ